MTERPASAPRRLTGGSAVRHSFTGARAVNPDRPTPLSAHCSCGWQSEPVINGEFAYQKWEQHRDASEHPGRRSDTKPGVALPAAPR